MSADAQPAPLAFTFCHASQDGEETICMWEASREALYALYEQGNEFSEAVLREQLVHALAHDRTPDAVGVGAAAAEEREQGF